MSGELLRPGDVVRARDERWSVSRIVSFAAASIVELQGCDRTNRGARARLLLPFESLQRVPPAAAARVVRAGRWRHLARAALSRAQPSYTALRAAARAKISILPFQLEPAIALTRGLASRVLVADDVGLGKTIQAGLAIAEAVARLDEPHVLVVVPAGIREQWQLELEQRFGIAAFAADAASLPRTGWWAPGANPWSMHPVVITSIDFVKRPEALRGLESLVWDLVVFDEAHSLSTRSDRNIAATAVAMRARTLMMLTATPHSGKDEEFARLCALGDFRGEFPLLVFHRTREDVGLPAIRRSIAFRVRLTRAEQRMHEALFRYARLVWRQKGATSPYARLAAIVLARRGCSSTAALAKSIERRLSLLSDAAILPSQLLLPIDDGADDEPPGAQLGAAGLHDAGEERDRLAGLLELARTAQAYDSKLAALRRLLRRSSEPAIVFTEYRDTVEHLRSELGVTSAVLHGGLSAAERRAALLEFTSGRGRVLLATDAASEGLNLHQHCRLVINLELPWTPRRLEQRTGRVERIGQLSRVHAVSLLAAGTFEEKTLAALTHRRERIREVVGALRGPGLDEHDVARSVFVGGAPSDEERARRLPKGVFTVDLRRVAAREADRIVTARQLEEPLTRIDGAPFVFAAPVRQPGGHVYWVFRIEFADCRSRILWDTLLAIRGDIAIPARRTAAEVRQLADLLRNAFCAHANRAHADAALVVGSAIRRPRALALRRERAIMAAARQHGARIAAQLSQRTLFSGPPSATVDQLAALNDLLSRCATHVERLADQQRVHPGRCEPGFALIRLP